MCGTVALGLLGGLIASKVLFRRRFRHHQHHGGSWGWRRRRFDAPPPPPVPADASQRVKTLLGRLELNQRQTEEANDAFGDISMALGAGWQSWPGLDEALAAVAAEPFDKARAQAALGTLAPEPLKLALDALEHVHNILLPEQREKLAGAVDWR